MFPQIEKYGPVATAPLLGSNSGSVEAEVNPFSPQSIATKALRQQLQATADTRYDPPVPPPARTGSIETFISGVPFLPTINEKTMDSQIIGVSLIVIGIVCSYNLFKKH